MSLTTKERLLAGSTPEPFAVPALGGEQVLLRPLSSPEAGAVQSAQVSGITASQTDAPKETGRVGQAAPRGARRAKADLAIDFEKVISGNYRAEALATHYGLVEPALSLEEVDQIRPVEVVEQIGREVMRRSGLGADQAEQLARFRRLAERSSDADAPSEREPADDDAGGAHASPA